MQTKYVWTMDIWERDTNKCVESMKVVAYNRNDAKKMIRRHIREHPYAFRGGHLNYTIDENPGSKKIVREECRLGINPVGCW